MKKHIPIAIPIEGGGRCVAHVDPDASPELVPALRRIAKAAYRQTRDEAKLEKAVCAAALDLLDHYEMDPVPHDGVGSYARILAAAKALRAFGYRRRVSGSVTTEDDGKDEP